MNCDIIEPYYHDNRVGSSVKIDFSKAIDTMGSAGVPITSKAHGNNTFVKFFYFIDKYIFKHV